MAEHVIYTRYTVVVNMHFKFFYSFALATSSRSDLYVLIHMYIYVRMY